MEKTKAAPAKVCLPAEYPATCLRYRAANAARSLLSSTSTAASSVAFVFGIVVNGLAPLLYLFGACCRGRSS